MDSPVLPSRSHSAGSTAVEVLGSVLQEQHGQGLMSPLPLHWGGAPSPSSQPTSVLRTNSKVFTFSHFFGLRCLAGSSDSLPVSP